MDPKIRLQNESFAEAIEKRRLKGEELRELLCGMIFRHTTEATRLLHLANQERMGCGHPAGCKELSQVGRPGGRFKTRERCLACVAAAEAEIRLLAFLSERYSIGHKDSNFRINVLEPLREEYIEHRGNLWKDRKE